MYTILFKGGEARVGTYKLNRKQKGREEMNSYWKRKKVVIGLSILTFAILSNTATEIVVANAMVNEEGTSIVTNKIEADSISIETNADQEFARGDLYSLTIKLSNQDGDIIPAGTKISIEIPVEAVDFGTIDLTNPELIDNFDVFVDEVTGKIDLILKKDIVGDSHILSRINIGVTGESAESYEVKVTGESNGTEIPISIDYPIIQILDSETNPPGRYGYLNKYWGISDKNKGGFTGRIEGTGDYKLGIFNRSINRISTFSQLNIMENLLLDLPTTWEFTYDDQQTLLPETIQLIDGGTRQTIPEEFYTITIISPTSFNVDISDGFTHKPTSSLELSYQTEVHDDSLVYINETTNTHKDIYGKEVTDTFKLHSKFALVGDSDFFPTITVEDKSFEVGYLTDTNIKEKLLENIKAQDTNDGDISTIIDVDYSKLDPNTVGEYEVVYYVENSLGNISRRTATIYITEKVSAGEIVVEYIDMKGNELAPKKTLEGKIGEAYVTEEIAIPGYKIKFIPANAAGNFTEDSQVVTYIYEGLLLFVSAPTMLDFGSDLAIPNTETTYNLEKTEGELVVADYRSVGSDWSMTGKVLSEMTSTSGHVLEGSLYYRNGTNDYLFTKNVSIPIHNETTKNSSPITISESWTEEGNGPKLKVKAGEPRNERYEGKIQWTLQNVPTSN